MKREDIIRMAHEAGILEYGYPVGERVAGELERFADLVAEAERVALMHMTTKAHAVDGHCDIVLAADIRARSTP